MPPLADWSTRLNTKQSLTTRSLKMASFKSALFTPLLQIYNNIDIRTACNTTWDDVRLAYTHKLEPHY